MDIFKLADKVEQILRETFENKVTRYIKKGYSLKMLFVVTSSILLLFTGAYSNTNSNLRVPLATDEGFGFDFKYCLDIDNLQLEIDPETASKEMFRKIVDNFVDRVSQYEIPVPENTILNVSLSTTEVRIWLRTFLYNGYDSIVMSKKKGRVYAYVRIEKGDFVYVVEDEGGGIPEDQIGRIFNSPINSFKGDVDLTKKHLFGECGAGLYSMASSVRRLGGEVRGVNKRDGCGAIFSLCVPLFKNNKLSLELDYSGAKISSL